MNRGLLSYLCCPDCRSTDLELLSRDQPDRHGPVAEGEVRCGSCGSRYPVINGIPRMLPRHLRPNLVALHRDFFARHPDLMVEGAPEAGPVAGTLQSFSHQHAVLNERAREEDRWRRIFLDSIAMRPEFFAGKVGLDAGCGEGRQTYWAHRFGAEVIGVDLSLGVEVTRSRLDDCGRCHVVQGDIHHLPIRDGVLDFVYSNGVLHHLPNPRRGFERLLPTLKPGGRISIWVYGLDGMRWWYRLSHLRWLRAVSSRVPRSVVYAMCVAMASALEVAVWLPCRMLLRVPGGRRIVDRIPLGDACRRSFKAKIRSVFDRLDPPVTHYHSAPELRSWLSDNSLGQLEIRSRDGCGWVATGVKSSAGSNGVDRPPRGRGVSIASGV